MKRTNEKGITLVVLVVTIIVLLILVAVSVNLVIGYNGIITRSKQVSTSTKIRYVTVLYCYNSGDIYSVD